MKIIVKRTIIVFLMFCLFISLAPIIGMNVEAANATLSGAEISNYVESLVGSSYPSGYCMAFVADCFEQLGATRSSSCCAYNYGNSHIQSTDSSNIPIGADVFFGNTGGTPSSTHGCNSPVYGHIGIYVGDGYFVHVPSSGKVEKTSLSNSYWGPRFRGWGYHGNVTITSNTTDNTDTTDTPELDSVSTILTLDPDDGYYYFTECEIDLGGKDLTVEGDLYIFDGDSVNLDGATLRVTGDLHVEGDLTVAKGTVIVDGDMIHSGGTVSLGKGTLNVTGDYHIASPYTNDANELNWEQGNGELVMQYAEDSVNVGGEFFSWCYSHTISAGTMTVAGDFTVKNGEFMAGESHKVILNGTSAQRVSFENGGYFGALDIQNGEGIILSGYLSAAEMTAAQDELKIQSEGGIFGDDNYCWLMIQIPTVTVEGDLAIWGEVYLQGNDLTVNGSVTVGDPWETGAIYLEKGKLNVSENLTLAYGILDVGKGTLDVAGDFYIANAYTNDADELDWEQGNGELVMQYAEDSVNVGGEFFSWCYYSHTISAGTMTVAGDFTVKNGEFMAGESHKVILNGTSAQRVSFENGGWFATLEIQNCKGLIIDSCLNAMDVTSTEEELKIQSEGGCIDLILRIPVVNVEGDLRIKYAELQGNTLNVNGNLTIGDVDYPYDDGTIYLEKGKLVVSGDFILARGDLDVGKGTLNVDGNMYIAFPAVNSANDVTWEEGNGELLMQYDEDVVNVAGDFLSWSNGGTYSAGVLTVEGDFLVKSGFYTEGTHETRLYGENAQTVTFENQDCFNILRIDKDLDQYVFTPMPCWNVLYGYVCDVHSGEWTVEAEATCTEDGLQTRVCDVCTTEETQVIPALGHCFGEYESNNDATCTEDGTKYAYCERCYEMDTIVDEGSALGHITQLENAWEATCTEEGYTGDQVCQVCGETVVKGSVIAMLAHTEVTDEGWGATCMEDGMTEGKHCSVCGTVTVEQEIIPAKGHTEVTDRAVAATCTKTGLTEGKHCSVCGTVTVEQEIIPAKGHTEAVDQAVAATCTKTGLTEGKHCSVCGTVTVEQEIIPAKGHTEVTDRAVAATCTKTGLTEGKHCSVCNTVLVAQETVPALGHEEVVDAAVAATCTETGKTEGKHCSVCNTVLIAQKQIAALGHKEVTDKGAAATCTEAGKTDGKHCSVCEAVTVKQETIPAKGHTEVIDKAVAATCTKTGLTEGKHCSVCDTVLVKQETVNAKGHSYKDVVVEPTAETQGYTEHTCTVCGDSYKDNYVDPVGHNTELKNTKEATCTEAGYTGDWVCKDCGKVTEKGAVIPAKGHDEVVDKAVAATCTEAGKTEGKHCDVCNTVTVKQETVPAKGHSYGDWYMTKAADCVTAGEEERACSACKHTEKRTVAAKGHAEVTDAAVEATCTKTGLTEGKHCSVCGTVTVKQETVPVKEHNYITEVIAPTNTEQGYTQYTCKDCGHSYKDNFVDPTGHEPELKNAKEATCTETGYTGDWVCKVCGETVTKGSVIPAKGHTEVTDAAVEATCTKTGLTEGKHCSVCGAVTVKQETVPVKEHTWNNGEITKEPTEKTEGEKTYTCTACGKTKTEKIPTLDHTHKYTESVTAPTCTEKGFTTYTCACGESYVDNHVAATGHKEEVIPAVEATCTKTGLTEGKKCAVCGEVIVEQQTVPAKDHAWDEGKVTKEPTEQNEGEKTYTCTACGETKNEKIPALDHIHKYTKIVTAPTCTEKGYTTYTCACGDSFVDSYVSALAHSWDSGIVTTEPTEKAPGVKTYTCGNCGETKTVEVPALEHVHNYGSAVTHPTCTEQGYTTYTCACGDSYKDHFTDAIGHTFGQWIVTQEPVNGQKGTKTRVCYCGQKETMEFDNPFTDVATGKYYSKAVFWAYENGITKGTSDTEFSLTQDCTRKQIVMFLWRAAGEPNPKNFFSPFSDVSINNSFAKAILWAVEQGITAGTGDGSTFSPNAPCTRKQIAMFLWRAAGKPEVDVSGNHFTDVSSNNSFAKAILWAYKQGITLGTGDGTTFSPDDTCTRGQIVTFMYRSVEKQSE